MTLNQPRFYAVGDCLILSEKSLFCALPFDLAKNGEKVTFYGDTTAHSFTPAAFLAWLQGDLESPFLPTEVFAQPKKTAVKSYTLRFALRLDSYKVENGGFAATISTPHGLELFTFRADTEAAALQAASDALSEPHPLQLGKVGGV